MRSAIISSFLAFFIVIGYSQSGLLLGEWKSLLPSNTGRHVATGNNKIFYGSDSGIFVMDEDDFENPQHYTTIDGLSAINVDNIAFDKTRGELIIAYNNSIIDIFSPEKITTIRDIFSNTSIQGSKQINDIYITDDGKFAYFATGFGVLQYNLEKREFGFNTFTSERVNSISILGSVVFAATEAGCYQIDLESNANENFFGDWKLLDSENGLGELYNSSFVEVIDESIYLTADDQIYRSTDRGITFDSIYTFDDSDFVAQDMIAYANEVMLVLKHESGQSQFVFFDDNNELKFIDEFCGDVTNGVAVDGQNRIWLGDDYRGIKYKTGVNGSCERIDFNSPYGFSASDLNIKGNQLFVASGGVNDNFNVNVNKDGFYEYSDNEWVVQNFKTTNKIDPDVSSFFAIESHPDPTNNLVYAGSYYEGLYVYDSETNEIVEFFDQYNTPDSGLDQTVGDPERTRIASLIFDDDDNLWIANFGAAKPLVVYTSNGNWFNFNVGSNNNISDLVIDNFGYIWMVVNGNSGGVYIYDTGEIIEDPNDGGERSRFIRNSDLPAGTAKSLALDVTGDVWVGTTEGAMVFECGSAVFDDDICNANHPKFVQDGIPAFLLQTELVQTILIDGANRKWFGTRNGIFVQNANTDEQIAHFTTENSPLFDNDVLHLEYKETTGEIYIATAKGIMIYRSEATGTSTRHRQEVYAFPNPVTPDHTGPIAIKGLARDANVKITDLNGKLVFETTALGGQAIWDGTHYDRSSKVGSGVYLVFSSTTDTFSEPDTFVTKILVVR